MGKSFIGRSLRISWLVFVFASLLATDAYACQQVRAALDIGSGSTKMVVARVDFCRNRVLRVLAPTPGNKLERKVEYKRFTVEDAVGRAVFMEEVVAKGIAVILELRALALAHGAEAFSAVATSAFRSVDPFHAQTVIDRIRQETGLRVAVISQEEEARIGFQAAGANVGIPVENLVVWDIGGGSMQISYWDHALNAVGGYRGKFANDAMHRFIFQRLQGKDPLTTASPNPIGRLGVSRAIHEAERVAREDVPAGLAKKLETLEEVVVGIGGPHFWSNCEFLRRFSADGCTFTREELLNQAQRLAALTDHELVEQGLSATLDFAPFRVSGAALTVGFMNALGMDKIRAIEVNMAGGILLESDFWMGALKGGSSEERVESSGWIWAIAILLVVAVFTAVFVTQRQLFSWTRRASNALTTHRGGFVSQRRKGQDLPLVLTAGKGLDRESGSRSRLCDRVRYGSFEKSTERGGSGLESRRPRFFGDGLRPSCG